MNRLLFVVVAAAVLAVACDKPPDGAVAIKADYVFIRDASGACLALARHVSVSGTETFQSGSLDIYTVPESNCQWGVGASPHVEK